MSQARCNRCGKKIDADKIAVRTFQGTVICMECHEKMSKK